MLAKFAEDDKLEQISAQKRRMKQQEHKRAVEILIEERRAGRELERVCRTEIFYTPSTFYPVRIHISN